MEFTAAEQRAMRRALELDKDNFFLLGHSWGGILALEYALTHQRHRLPWKHG